MAEALEGIRVLDLTHWQQGPVAAAMLGDWGADVIKVESPDLPDAGRSMVRYETKPGGVNAYFEMHNRNKRGIALDLKGEAGLQVFYRLARQADVLVQNFRPGVSERLKISYETISALNPRLIYCTASAFGLQGPDAGLPALDPLAQARGGIMSVTGEPETPPTRTFNGFADQVSAFLLAFGIMLALFHRERSGQGQLVDGSLLQAMLSVQSFNISSFLMTGLYGGAPIPRISRKLTSPLWNHYRAQDNKWVMLTMAQPGRYWPPFRETMREASGENLQPEEMSIEWMMRRPGELMQLVARLDELFATKPAAEWLRLFRERDLLIEVVQGYADITNDPQVQANRMITRFDHPGYGPLDMINVAVNLHETPGAIRRPAPEFGQHSEEVLLEYGFSWEEIEGLRQAGVIGLRV
ncbi:MAG TPA: CoA transferase [Dehalococcoidia bacterium]|nr:CoA transferase [Dehalococcoidia bacterium]